MGDFWVIGNKVSTPTSSAFILLPSEVRERAHCGEEDGRASYWLQLGDYERGPFCEAWGVNWFRRYVLTERMRTETAARKPLFPGCVRRRGCSASARTHIPTGQGGSEYMRSQTQT